MSAITCTRAAPSVRAEDGLPQLLRETWLLRDVLEVDAAGTVTAAPYGAQSFRTPDVQSEGPWP